MSNKRLIDGRIRTSQTFAGLTYRQRDLWHGLIVEADDQGRLPGTAGFVRSRVWPHDHITETQVNQDLAALEASGNICRYSAGGAAYIQIVNWWKYQQMQWAGPSDSPAPEGWVDRLRYHTRGNKIVTQAWDMEGGFGGSIPSGLPNPLPNPLPSPLPSGLSCDEDEDEDEDEIIKASAAKNRAARKPTKPTNNHQEPSLTATVKTPRPPKIDYYPLANAISIVCHMPLEPNRGRLFREAEQLAKAIPEPTPELVSENYNSNPKSFWKLHDWRGQKGQNPSPANIRETWGAWLQNGKATAPNMSDPEVAARMNAELNKNRKPREIPQ